MTVQCSSNFTHHANYIFVFVGIIRQPCSFPYRYDISSQKSTRQTTINFNFSLIFQNRHIHVPYINKIYCNIIYLEQRTMAATPRSWSLLLVVGWIFKYRSTTLMAQCKVELQKSFILATSTSQSIKIYLQKKHEPKNDWCFHKITKWVNISN